MSSITIDPSPAQLEALTLDRVGHQTFDKAAAIALHKLGESERAQRLDLCGRYFHMHRCPDGHTFRVNVSHCQLRFACPNCSKLRALDLLNHYFPIEKVISSFQIIYLEKSMIRDSDHIKSFSNQLASWSKSRRTKPELYLQWIDRHKNGVLYVRIIYSGPLDLGLILRERLSNTCAIQVRNCYPAQYAMELPEFMKPYIADHPEEKAELEILFMGIRQLRASGRLVSGYLKERSTNTTNTTQDDSQQPPTSSTGSADGGESSEPPSTPVVKGSCRCPTCGKQSVAASQRLTFMVPSVKLEWTDFKIPASPPEDLAWAA